MEARVPGTHRMSDSSTRRRFADALRWALFASCLTIWCLWGEQPGAKRAVFAATSDLVLVPLHVTDRAGRTVTDLAPDRLQVLEEKQPRTILNLFKEDGPVSIGVVFDLSGSMSGALPLAIEALRTFAEAAQPEDEMFLVTCSTAPRLAVDFTRDASDLTRKLAFVHADGSTALIDSIYMALDHLRSGRYRRKALVVFSDGRDNHSRYRFSELLALAVEADAQVYTLEIPTYVRRRGHSFDILGNLSDATGGLHFELGSRKDLPDASARTAEAIRNVYVIGFRPASGPSGKRRRIQVTPRAEDRRSLRVTASSTYFIPE
jgi:Ca-activated chloride channel homolog